MVVWITFSYAEVLRPPCQDVLAVRGGWDWLRCCAGDRLTFVTGVTSECMGRQCVQEYLREAEAKVTTIARVVEHVRNVSFLCLCGGLF